MNSELASVLGTSVTSSAVRYRGKYRELRLAVLDVLGNKCVKCGFADERALQLDHIEGGGNKQRKGPKFNNYRYYLDIVEGRISLATLQLLCANCNWIKKVVNGEVKKLGNGRLSI